MRNKILLLLVSAVFAIASASAQGPDRREPRPRPDRKEWLNKMKEVKHDFMARELNIADTQKSAFFQVYDQWQDARFELENSARRHEREVMKKKEKATDKEIESIINEQFAIEKKLGQIDEKFLPKFKEVLTLGQLVRLKQAERAFNAKLMECNKDKHPKPKK